MEEKRKLLVKFEKILKIFDENSIEKLNFYFIFILKNLLLKIERSETTPFFYNLIPHIRSMRLVANEGFLRNLAL